MIFADGGEVDDVEASARLDDVQERLQQIRDGERTADGRRVRGFVADVPVGKGNDGVCTNFVQRRREPIVYRCDRVDVGRGVGLRGKPKHCEGDVVGGVCRRCKRRQLPPAESEESASSSSCSESE
jgi:hypothetical protein